MNETFVSLRDGQMFVRHSGKTDGPDRTAIVWIHGLGESSLCFLEAFSRSELRDFALIAPDMLGFGKSSPASDGDYSFDAQITRLWAVCDYFGVQSPCLVGHSMGGDIATFMAAAGQNHTVRAIINAEGDLTSDDLFISTQAVEAARHGDFDRWFREDFMEATVLRRWAPDWSACRRYYASLWFCRPDAFLASAEQVCLRNTDVPGQEFSLTGSSFTSLGVPKLYCWSDKSLSTRSRSVLNAGVPNVCFENSFHWMMIDSSDLFYGTVSAFLREHVHGGGADG